MDFSILHKKIPKKQEKTKATKHASNYDTKVDAYDR